MLLFGVVFIAIFPSWSAGAAKRVVESPGWSVVWGLVVLIAAPIAAIIALITVVGIPIGVASLAAYAVSLMLAINVSSLAVGGLALRGRYSIWAQLALGLAIVYLIGAIPVLGWLVWIAVLLFGLGALALNVVRARPQPA